MRKLWFIFMIVIGRACLAADFLPVWQAFQVKVVPATNQYLWVKFDIAPEYHIYQNKIKINALMDSQVRLGAPIFPDAQVLSSPDLGSFKVYEGKTAIQVPIQNYGNGQLDLQVNYQGCKGLDMCFPEQSVKFNLNLNEPAVSISSSTKPNTTGNSQTTSVSEKATGTAISDMGTANYFNHSFPLVVASFFVLGLLIAFTPCVFPLLPVLIGVIAGKNISTRRSFALAGSYITGGAVMYAVAGVIAASLGYSLSGYLQSVWLNSVLVMLFAGFGLVLLVNIDLQMPINWQNRLNSLINRRNHKSLTSAFIIGGISNLILSPCVTAPLAGALVYISSTGDTLLGGSALFALGLGSGVPLLIIAVFGRKFLPKSGNWMNFVKKLLGLVLLGVAFYQLSKIISLQWIAGLVLIWLILSCWILVEQILRAYTRKWRLGVIGVFSLFIMVMPFYYSPVKNLFIVKNNDRFTVVTTSAQLNNYLAQAKTKHQPVVIDFYADWCIACKEMDIKTFSDKEVNHLMNNYMLLRVDVTSNDVNAQQLQSQYQIIAPPSMVFIDGKGEILKKYQVNGFIASNQLSSSLKQVLGLEKLVYSDCDNDNGKC